MKCVLFAKVTAEQASLCKEIHKRKRIMMRDVRARSLNVRFELTH